MVDDPVTNTNRGQDYCTKRYRTTTKIRIVVMDGWLTWNVITGMVFANIYTQRYNYI